MKAEFSGRVQFSQTGHELAPKHSAEDTHRQEEAGARRNPPGVVGRQSAGRNHAVDMVMMLQFLIPGMQHDKEADVRPKVSVVASHRQQRLGAGPKQQSVDLALVLQG